MLLTPTVLPASLPIPALWLDSIFRLQLMGLMLFQEADKKGDVYSILWVLVFGFRHAQYPWTGGRRFEPSRNRLNFGETLAILVVVVSIILLGWEMLTLFKIFPIKLHPHD